MNSTIKTIVLFGALAVLLISTGRLLGGDGGMWLMAGISVLINVGMYFFSDKIAIRSAKAKPLKDSKIESVIRELTHRAELPMPKIYSSPNPQPNAFATGRNPKHSAIVVTKGLLHSLDREEVKGVLAHEIGHIKNRDILISTVAAVAASMITTLGFALRWGGIIFTGGDQDRNPIGGLLVGILAPIGAVIIQMAISRSREFKADETGAKLVGSPTGLANALEKIDRVSKNVIPMKVNPAFENLYISNPLRGGGLVQKFFSTHPSVEERVSRLRKMSF